MNNNEVANIIILNRPKAKKIDDHLKYQHIYLIFVATLSQKLAAPKDFELKQPLSATTLTVKNSEKLLADKMLKNLNQLTNKTIWLLFFLLYLPENNKIVNIATRIDDNNRMSSELFPGQEK